MSSSEESCDHDVSDGSEKDAHIRASRMRPNAPFRRGAYRNDLTSEIGTSLDGVDPSNTPNSTDPPPHEDTEPDLWPFFQGLENGAVTLQQLLYNNCQFERSCTYRHLVHILLCTTEDLQNVHKDCHFHYDVTPQNIVVLRNGAAHVVVSPLSFHTQRRKIPWRLAGPLGYTAPELFFPQRNGTPLELTHNIDNFSLSAVMMECLTRKHPLRIQKDVGGWGIYEKIGECCECNVHDEWPVVGGTDASAVKDDLLERLDEKMTNDLLPWPVEFWSLAADACEKFDDRNVSPRELTAMAVVEKLRDMCGRLWNKEEIPWPPELCLLIAECSLGTMEEGKNWITRPNTAEIQQQLEAMLERPWIDDFVNWVDKEDRRKSLRQRLTPGSVCICDHGTPLHVGELHCAYEALYMDTSGRIFDVAVETAKYPGDRHALNALKVKAQFFKKICKSHPNVVHFYGCFSKHASPTFRNTKMVLMKVRTDFLVVEPLQNSLWQRLYEDYRFMSACSYRRMIRIFLDVSKGMLFLLVNDIEPLHVSLRSVMVDESGRAKLAACDYWKSKTGGSVRSPAHGMHRNIVPGRSSLLGRKGERPSNAICSLGAMMRESFLACKHPMDAAVETVPFELRSLINVCLQAYPDSAQDKDSGRIIAQVVESLQEMLGKTWVDEKIYVIPRKWNA